MLDIRNIFQFQRDGKKKRAFIGKSRENMLKRQKY